MVDEAFGMDGIGRVQDGGTGRLQLGRSSIVDRFGCQQADAGVAMLGVVPGKELLTEGACPLDAGETLRAARAIRQGFELRLGTRIVVGDVRTRVRLGHAQVGEQEGHGLRGHRGAAIGMDRELARGDLLLGEGLGNQALGKGGLLLMSDHPADDVATEDVEDDVEREVGPFAGTEQFRDIPAPDLVGTGREEFGLGIGRMDELITALPRLASIRQETLDKYRPSRRRRAPS